MTDLAKAVAFAKYCLHWDDALPLTLRPGVFRARTPASERFFPNDVGSLIHYVQEFLGDRYFIQINRDKTGLFQWQVIVGQQGLTAPFATYDHSRADNEDLLDAIFDACVDAARRDRRG